MKAAPPHGPALSLISSDGWPELDDGSAETVFERHLTAESQVPPGRRAVRQALLDISRPCILKLRTRVGTEERRQHL